MHTAAHNAPKETSVTKREVTPLNFPTGLRGHC